MKLKIIEGKVRDERSQLIQARMAWQHYFAELMGLNAQNSDPQGDGSLDGYLPNYYAV